MGYWGALSAGARERKSGRVLSHAVHGGDEVAVGGAVGARGTGRRAPARVVEGGRSLGATRGRPQQAGRGSGALLRWRAAWFCTGGEKQKSRQEEDEAGLVCNFKKFQGPNCKPAITFNLGLK